MRARADHTPQAETSTLTAALGPKQVRFHDIDLLRGLVMVLMTIDHARDYAVGANVGDPMRVEEVSGAMFLTRFVSHFCAPTFILLAGLSARLLRNRGMSARDLSRHLLLRGAILVAFELTLVDLAWNFYPLYSMKYLQVIWAIGLSMMVLGLLVRLPLWTIGAFGAALVLGHNAIEELSPDLGAAGHALWSVLFEKSVLETPLWFSVRTTYPIAAPMGLVALGYVLGGLFKPHVEPAERSRALFGIAAVCALAYFVLRATSLYGDPHDFATGSTGWVSVMSFFNPTKYPLSLQFMLMALAPAFALLAWARDRDLSFARPLLRLGSVPMFFYLAHLYVIHAGALLSALAMGYSLESMDFVRRLGGVPEGFQLPLWGIYLLAGATTLFLYPACTRYAAARRKYGGILRYI